jgi:hypothetical protein
VVFLPTATLLLLRLLLASWPLCLPCPFHQLLLCLEASV